MKIYSSFKQEHRRGRLRQQGVASPFKSSSKGFVGRGRTAGGAREFVVPNTKISNLKNVKTRNPDGQN